MKTLMTTALAAAITLAASPAAAKDREPTRPSLASFTQKTNYGREHREEAREKRKGPERANERAKERANHNSGLGCSPT